MELVTKDLVSVKTTCDSVTKLETRLSIFGSLTSRTTKDTSEFLLSKHPD